MTRPDPDRHLARCADVRANVFEFFDAELADADRVRIDAHLSACPPCARFFAHERAFLQMIEHRAPTDECPDALRARIRSAITQRRDRQRES